MRGRARKAIGGRVRFLGNPWPKGHAIVAFGWSGRLDPERGAVFDLHLETEDYVAGDRGSGVDDGDEQRSTWRTRGAWSNFKRCTLSSTQWGDQGIVVGTARRPFDFAALDGRTLRADPKGPEDPEDVAFGIYLLGHDSAARHAIHFTRLRGGAFSIRWTGRIALTYTGEDELRHRFEATIPRAEFRGFVVPKGIRPKDAAEQLGLFVRGGASFRTAKFAGKTTLVP